MAASAASITSIAGNLLDPTSNMENKSKSYVERSRISISNSEGSDSTSSDSNGVQRIKCSAVSTMERDMPDFDYSHLVDELREKILKECELNPWIFSKEDMEKCKHDRWFVARYLLRNKLDVDAALDMMKKALRFRNEALSSYLGESDFPAEFYMLGGLFAYLPDRKGNKMLYIRVRMHRKIPEIQSIFQTFLFHQLNSIDEQAHGKGISVVFDCTGGGLANADMDLLFFLVSMLINYFPKGLSYFLVHNLPWMLKPFWLIAKAWIPNDKREMIKFSDEKTVFEYVDKENLPDFMGGTSDLDYKKPPGECVTLEEACKLLGIKHQLMTKILDQFQDFLPDENVQRIREYIASRRTEDDDQKKEAKSVKKEESIEGYL